jgi:hypothetical protein
MSNDTANPDAPFLELVAAYGEEDDPAMQRLFLRAALRRLEVNLGRVARDLHVLIERTSEVKP